MSGAGGTHITYASRKRRKPVQKTVKPVPPEGVKSNPSKRHRDRLNTELDRLASLLPFPQDVISKLDKLSVLRLSVSYLRAKSFFDVALKSCQDDRNGSRENNGARLQDSLCLQEGELLLQALNGFVLVVTTDALVFYASSTIQDYLGFQQSDVIHQSVYELIHTEDRAEFQRQLHWMLNPGQPADSVPQGQEGHGLPQPSGFYNPEQLPSENSPFLERCFICRLRCLLDNSSGFLAMNFQGRLKFLHGQNKKGKDGTSLAPQLALFAVATPLQPPSILEIRTKNFIFRTKHKLDFTPTGCDAKGKLVLGYTEAELCMRGSGYQFIHAADMLYCAESHIRMIKTGESGMTVFRLLTKENRWTWVQSNARLVYKNGRPDYIIATQRPLTDEEGMEHLRKRGSKLPFMFATGEAILYEVTFSFPVSMDPLLGRPKGPGAAKEPCHPSSLLGAMLQQDESVYLCPPAPRPPPLERGFASGPGEELDGLGSGEWPENLAGEAELGQGPQDRCGSFADELHSIMKGLGVSFDDLRRLQQEQFFRGDVAEEDDIGDLDLTDEILTYVQSSLNKGPFSPSAAQPPLQPQPPLEPQHSLLQQPQHHLEQQPQHSLQPQHHLEQQPQHHLEQQPQHHLEQQAQHSLQPQHHLEQQAQHSLQPQHHLEQQAQHSLQPQHHLEQQAQHSLQPQHHLEQQAQHSLQPQHHLEQQAQHSLQPQHHLEQQAQHSLQPQHHLEQQAQHPLQPQHHLQQQQPQHSLQPQHHLQQQPQHSLQPQHHLQQQPQHSLQPQHHLQQQPQHHLQQQPQHPLQEQHHLQQQPQHPLQEQHHLQQQPQHSLQPQHHLQQPQPSLQPEHPLLQQSEHPLLQQPQPPLQAQPPLQQPPVQEMPHIPSSSCMVQEQLEQQWRQQHLCQKMKHLQVDGLLASWRPGEPEPFPCVQQEPCDVFPDPDFQSLPYTQSLMSCSQALFPQPAPLDHLDFPVGSFEQSPFPMSHLGDFVSCLQQTPESTGYGGQLQPTLAAPSACYAGAVSMFPCQPEDQASNMDPMQYNPMASNQHTLLNKNGLNGGILNETYPAQLNGLNNPQSAACLHQAEARPFPDLPSNGLL
ncbi:aryl hydrocarbon receptor [Antechinus flavipes]|uniref:aryl hydrocarbon receptor n=1 Tax=Antechinus flavipes TaxID=38775 RepID=UPI002236273F|nr:aryl hydrocarbon receptor [Antechinus flavipes]